MAGSAAAFSKIISNTECITPNNEVTISVFDIQNSLFNKLLKAALPPGEGYGVRLK
ncbi:hypothetical protein HDC91_001842 [Mucilaginibacter sp. AK015]|nr:hypothetical protein [Mucilaginibacter sp. AK015]